MPCEWEEWALRALAAVEPYEVRQGPRSQAPLAPSGRAPRLRLSVLTVWGRTIAGRALIVAVYHVGEFTWKIVGARDLTLAELAEFTGWEESR